VVKKEDGKWHLTLTEAIQDGEAMSIKQYDETFDAVVIATGQFQDPTLPPLHGLVEYNAHFPGRITHSKQFRRNEDFKDKVKLPRR
jgi:cation diffusion facilitator CzcD-associated flavoprotein CzcO